jgi:hypothetical protein
VSRRAPRRRSRRRPILLGVGAVALAAAVFLAGLGLGRALEEGELDPSLRTQVRTLTPTGLPPAGRTVTVRVTVTSQG